jgi:hypothetical protein
VTLTPNAVVKSPPDDGVLCCRCDNARSQPAPMVVNYSHMVADDWESRLEREGLAPIERVVGGAVHVPSEARGGTATHIPQTQEAMDEAAAATQLWITWASEVQRAVDMSIRESAVWTRYANNETISEISQALGIKRTKVSDAIMRVRLRAPLAPCPHPRAKGSPKQRTRIQPQGDPVEKPGRQTEEYAQIELCEPIDLTANGTFRLALGGPTKRSVFKEIEARPKIGGGFEFPVDVIRNKDQSALTLWLTVGPMQVKYAYKVSPREAATP